MRALSIILFAAFTAFMFASVFVQAGTTDTPPILITADIGQAVYSPGGLTASGVYRPIKVDEQGYVICSEEKR